MPTTAADVARWMLDELEANGYLYQEVAVRRIDERFGEGFTYLNDNYNEAIDRKVLAAFRKLSEDTVVWSRSEKCWSKRSRSDAPGRRQD